MIVELLIMMVSRMDSEMLGYPGREFNLLVNFIEQQIVLLAHHSVTVSAVFGENLETYITFIL